MHFDDATIVKVNLKYETSISMYIFVARMNIYHIFMLYRDMSVFFLYNIEIKLLKHSIVM